MLLRVAVRILEYVPQLLPHYRLLISLVVDYEYRSPDLFTLILGAGDAAVCTTRGFDGCLVLLTVMAHFALVVIVRGDYVFCGLLDVFGLLLLWTAARFISFFITK